MRLISGEVSKPDLANIQAVVFDMYETLVPNPPEAWLAAFAGICHDQALSVEPARLYKEWKVLEIQFRKNRLNLADPAKSPPFKSYEEAWRDCFRDVFAHLGLSGDAAAAAKDAVRAMAVREPYREVSQALPRIQRRWRTAVLSNADDDYLLPLIAAVGLKFEAVLSSEMVRAYKPHPLPFQRMIGRLEIQPEEGVYVGDNPFDDIMGAKGVGMRTVWVNRNGASLDPSLPPPDRQVKSLAQLPGILERWK